MKKKSVFCRHNSRRTTVFIIIIFFFWFLGSSVCCCYFNNNNNNTLIITYDENKHFENHEQTIYNKKGEFRRVRVDDQFVCTLGSCISYIFVCFLSSRANSLTI